MVTSGRRGASNHTVMGTQKVLLRNENSRRAGRYFVEHFECVCELFFFGAGFD